MRYCKKCNEYRFNENDCKCIEFTIIDEYGKAHQIFANHEQEAAIKHAEINNIQGDCVVNESNEIKIEGKAFTITTETDVSYSVNKI